MIDRRKRLGSLLDRTSYSYFCTNVPRAATQPEAPIIAQEHPKPNKPAKPTAPPRDTMTPSDIRTLRKSLNLTQPEFAEIVGVTTITVSSWERDIRNPSGSAMKILRTLKTP